MKKYKTKQGEYLAVVEAHLSDMYSIAWMVPSIGDIGTFVGESYQAHDAKPTSVEDLELWISDTTSAKLADTVTPNSPHMYKTKKQASKALAIINAALCDMDVQLPDWAVKAMAEGWTAPAGWRP